MQTKHGSIVTACIRTETDLLPGSDLPKGLLVCEEALWSKGIGLQLQLALLLQALGANHNHRVLPMTKRVVVELPLGERNGSVSQPRDYFQP